MKKSLLVLTAALSFGMASAQTDAPASATQVPSLTDVPAGHWAKDAIDKLVSRGIILGYPDGTYRGTQNLTRYEAAVIIARLLDQIRTGEVPASGIDADTLAALQNAIQELAADLAALGVRVSDLEENAVSRDDFTRLEERVETIAASQGDAEALNALQGQIDELTARADDYDTLRADVDDSASSIAALNDLTVLLNQDILNLQDRVSAVEAAQADLVGRADFDNLSGRVGVVETKVTSLDNRVTQLEKYAFSIKPSLGATYYVARSTRNMDVDRLIAGTVFGKGDDGDGDTKDTAVDYADLTNGRVLVVNDAANYYGFSGAGNYGTTATTGNAVRVEGKTDISLSINFSNSGKFGTATSATTGAFVPSAGGLNVNSVDLSFGVQAGFPSGSASAGPDGVFGTPDDVPATSFYPDVRDPDTKNIYRPLFFYFNNATANFTVGNAPVVVTFGKGLKFKFADYLGDNDKTGRGDGFNVLVDGSTVPVIGAFKPTLNFVYGSRGGANGDNLYYRGVRATITPVGTLKAGLQVLEEGADAFGQPAGTPNDVTAFGADLHGTVAGWQLDSEYAMSRVSPNRFAATPAVEQETAFYAKTAGSLGPVKVYDLNYRTISTNYDKVAGISEANPTDGDNGSTAPYAANQTGFGFKVGGSLGPVAVGAYLDNKVDFGLSPFSPATAAGAVVQRGAAAKVSLFNLVTVRGGYYEHMENALGQAGVRYNVRGDVTPGLGLAIGAYYRNVAINGTRTQSDAGLFARGKYNSNFTLVDNEFTNQEGCADQHPSIAGSDLDGVGGALTFTQRSFTDKNCYSEFGVEVSHNGKDANALVKNLDLRLGYASRYRNTGNSYSNTFFYGDALYSAKFGVANVNVKGAFANDGYTAADLAANPTAFSSTAAAFGVKVVSDPLNVIFKPSVEAQVGYYTRSHDFAAAGADYTSTGLKYLVGVKMNEFLLPNTKLAVYYAGYNGTNRAYRPYDSASNTAGAFIDQNNGGATVSQNLLYVEGNYYDLSFGYGMGNLSLNNVTTPTSERGSVFKINYKVNF
ncbi:S-layer homology domain-containing protein [Deinococcus koreensis]|uniref:S-layer protein n=1 Tax=Deinococcus koreensis TaxID=2054903 RepID=A0A2K3UZ42_9DEIO|nr:S-layer homology domain-containing protein [Deinococcus koreensis]PNY81804.1 S-layer protein [Deinococcus koreensis]